MLIAWLVLFLFLYYYSVKNVKIISLFRYCEQDTSLILIKNSKPLPNFTIITHKKKFAPTPNFYCPCPCIKVWCLKRSIYRLKKFSRVWFQGLKDILFLLLAFTVSKLAQFISNPRPVHWNIMKCVLWYLSGAQMLALRCTQFTSSKSTRTAMRIGGQQYRPKESGGLHRLRGRHNGYLENIETAQSHQFKHGSEFQSITDIVAEIDWLVYVFKELGVTMMTPSTIWCDNIGATHFTSNSAFHTKMKHVALDFNFVQECVKDKVLHVVHILNVYQRVDVLMRALQPWPFEDLKHKLIDAFRWVWGDVSRYGGLWSQGNTRHALHTHVQ